MLPVLGPQHQHDTAATRTDVMCEPDRLRLHRRTVRRIHYLDAIGPTRNRGSSMPTTTVTTRVVHTRGRAEKPTQRRNRATPHRDMGGWFRRLCGAVTVAVCDRPFVRTSAACGPTRAGARETRGRMDDYKKLPGLCTLQGGRTTREDERMSDNMRDMVAWLREQIESDIEKAESASP